MSPVCDFLLPTTWIKLKRRKIMTTLWGDCFFTEEVSLATNLHHSLNSPPLPSPSPFK